MATTTGVSTSSATTTGVSTSSATTTEDWSWLLLLSNETTAAPGNGTSAK